MIDLLAEPVVDLLAETQPNVVDFLGEQITALAEDCFCLNCGHGLTAHTRGLIVHDRCLMCDCKQAVLTESAIRKVKHGLLP